MKSTPKRYGAVPVTIHWLTAILILFALVLGFQAANTVGSDAKAALLRVHIPAAVIVLLLTAFRIVWWWLFDKKPDPVQGLPLWQERLASGVHIALYIVIVAMIGSGIGIVALSGAGPTIFGGGGELPDFLQYPPRIGHGLGAFLLILLLFAHIGAALYHHFIRRDGLIRRMWYGH